MRFMRGWLVVAVGACLAVAGCGSADESASFIRDYNRAQEPLRGLVAELETGGAATGSDAGRFARELRATATEFDRVRARVGKLDAPAGATDEVAEYLSALDSGADEIRRMARAVKQRDLHRLTKVTGTFKAAMLQVGQAEVSLSTAVE